MSESLNLISVVRTLYKWKWLIVVPCLLVAVLSVVLSLQMPNYYASNTIFFASNPALADRGQLFKAETGDVPLSAFGDKEDTDRLLSIGKSAQINGYVINKYDLMTYYEVDSEDKLAEYKVNQKFNKNYEIFKNELGAIEVHFSDVDPEQAAKIANDIMFQIDGISNSLVANNQKEFVQLFKKEFEAKQKAVRLLTDSISNAKLDANAMSVLIEVKNNAVEDLNNVSTLYDQYRAAADKKISSIFVLEEAYPSVKKSRPKRSFIVLGALLSTFLVMSLLAIVIERLRNIDLESVDV